PLGGLHTALRWADELGLDGVLVLACDLPLVNAAALSLLVNAWEGGSVDAVAPVGPGGIEPLCALYSVRVLPAAEAALDAGERSLLRLLARLRTRDVPLEGVCLAAGVSEPFLNVNTPASRLAAERLLSLQSPPRA